MIPQVSEQPEHETHIVYGRHWNVKYRVMIDPHDVAAVAEIFRKRGEFEAACGIEPLKAKGVDGVTRAMYARDGQPNEDFSPAVWKLRWDGEGPKADAPYVSVDFYNVWGSNVGSYSFQRWEGSDQLFLHQINTWHYPKRMGFQDLNEATRSEVSRFNPFGYHLHEDITINPDRSENVTTTEYKDYDPAPHWEPIPEFGDWRGLTRRNRFT